MKKIKRKKKFRKVVVGLHDVIPIAWEVGLPCPPPHVEQLTQEEVAHQFPHLMTLYLAHRGCVKSHGLIKTTAEALLKIEQVDLVRMGPQELKAAGIDVSNMLRIEQAAEEAGA